MGLDIRTIIFIIGIARLMQVLVFYYQYKSNKSLSGPGWWFMWSAAETVGFSLILLRSILFLLPYIILIQNPILLSGAFFIYIGVLKFFEKKVNYKIIGLFYICFIFLHLFFFLVINEFNIRSLLLDVFVAGIAFITAFTIYRNKTASIALTINFNTIILIVHGTIFMSRAIANILGFPFTEIIAPTILNYLLYLDALIVSLLWTYALIMLLNQRLNAEIIEAKTHFEEIFNTSPDAVAINRLSDGMYVDCNENFSKVTGYTKAEISGRSSLDLNIWLNPAERFELVDILLKKGYFDNNEMTFVRKNGEIVNGLMSAKLTTLKGVPHIITVTHDISERKKAEHENQLKTKELQKLNSEKDKFFSIIAHDLKSPFNSILGFSELLVDKVKENDLEGIETFADIILNSSKSVFELVSNLMTWSRSQTGRLEFIPETFHLAKFVDNNIHLFHDIANQKNIIIKKEVANDLIVFADQDMSGTILRNLISNAIKFTFPDGNITVSAKREDGMIAVKIKDTGVGIPTSSMEKLFRIDVHYSTPGTQNEEGTGLGLILCKEFIEKQGGEINVESEPGIGSVFTFTLPSNTAV